MTFYEANETQRVRDSNGLVWRIGELISALHDDNLNLSICNRGKWEVVEELLEFYFLVGSEKSIGTSRWKSREEALIHARYCGWPYIALFREVPGTREKVKP